MEAWILRVFILLQYFFFKPALIINCLYFKGFFNNIYTFLFHWTPFMFQAMGCNKKSRITEPEPFNDSIISLRSSTSSLQSSHSSTSLSQPAPNKSKSVTNQQSKPNLRASRKGSTVYIISLCLLKLKKKLLLYLPSTL